MPEKPPDTTSNKAPQGAIPPTSASKPGVKDEHVHKTGELDLLLDNPPFWQVIINGFKTMFEKPPELKLESKPIPVQDIWAQKKPLGARIGSVAIHLAIIAVCILLIKPVTQVVQKMEETHLTEPPPPPPPLLVTHLSGGGSPNPTQPRLIVQTPPPDPMAPPTNIVPLTEAASAANQQFFGNMVGMVGGPPGNGGGGSGGGTGGAGDCTSAEGCISGPGVVPPELIYSPDPDYSDAARKAKFQGTVVVIAVVGADGKVKSTRVEQELGLGLDDEAKKAVMNWKFKPAMYMGKPVQVQIDVEVNFRLY